MPMISNAASQALGVSQQFQPGSLQAMLDQQNNDMLLKQKRLKQQQDQNVADPNAQYSSSASYRALLGLGV